MTIRKISLVLSLGLLVWLLVDSVLQFDIAATKNNELTNSKKLEVDKMENIDSVKVYAKSVLDTIRQNTRNDSLRATKRTWLILVLIFIQLPFWTSNTRIQKKLTE